MPTARQGAPPVRPITVFSPTRAASEAISAAVTGKPCALTHSRVCLELIAKYWPGGSEAAETIAMIATKLSSSMLP